MNESSQAIVAVKRDVQLSEWQRQVQERQEQGIPVDEWCASLGISKGAYYHRLRKVREYMCQQMVETHPNWECDLRSGNNSSFKAIPHKERLATLHAICLQISRHISQKCS